MPNSRNVSGPVSLVGFGRSGTTLVTNLFRGHQDFRVLGETSNTIFSTFRNIEEFLPLTGPLRGDRTVEEATRDAVHSLLIDLYGSDKPMWFHKPIFIPKVAGSFDDDDQFAKWYWSTFRGLFPDAKVFTVLRDPAEVARSSLVRWGGNVADILRRIERVYGLLLHEDSMLHRGFAFEAIEEDPDAFARDLMEFAGVPFHESLLGVFDRRFAVNPESDAAAPKGVPDSVQDAYLRLKDLFV